MCGPVLVGPGFLAAVESGVTGWHMCRPHQVGPSLAGGLWAPEECGPGHTVLRNMDEQGCKLDPVLDPVLDLSWIQAGSRLDPVLDSGRILLDFNCGGCRPGVSAWCIPQPTNPRQAFGETAASPAPRPWPGERNVVGMEFMSMVTQRPRGGWAPWLNRPTWLPWISRMRLDPTGYTWMPPAVAWIPPAVALAKFIMAAVSSSCVSVSSALRAFAPLLRGEDGVGFYSFSAGFGLGQG